MGLSTRSGRSNAPSRLVTRDHLKQLKTCQMLIGNEQGPQGRCYALAEMPVRLGEHKIQCCGTHAKALKEARERELQQQAKPSIVLTDLQ